MSETDEDAVSYPVNVESGEGAGSFDSGAVYLDFPDEGEYRLSILPSQQLGRISIAAAFKDDQTNSLVTVRVQPDEAREYAEDLIEAVEYVEAGDE